MKIDYTEFLKKNRTEESDAQRKKAMFEKLRAALVKAGIHGRISATYYTDGNVRVSVNGEYFNIFNSDTEKWFSGYVGDAR